MNQVSLITKDGHTSSLPNILTSAKNQPQSIVNFPMIDDPNPEYEGDEKPVILLGGSSIKTSTSLKNTHRV